MTIDLAALGWNQRRIADYAPFIHPSRTPGRIVGTDSGVCGVITAAGTVRASLAGTALIEAASDLSRLPCAGDWVVVRAWSDRRLTIETVLPRTTMFPDQLDDSLAARALAANADAVAVVEPLGRGPNLGRIDRLLEVARRSGAEPHVVLTATEVLDKQVISEVSQLVAAVAAGAPIHLVAPGGQDRLARLRSLATSGRTLAILGPPNSGRSGLINALAGVSVPAGWGNHRGVRTPRTSRGIRTASAIRGNPGLRNIPANRAQSGSRPSGGPVLVALPFGGAVIDLPVLPGSALLDLPGLWTKKLS